MTSTCILAADEHHLLRSLKRVIEPDFEVVAMVDNVASLSDSIGSLEPALVVLDLCMLHPKPLRTLQVLCTRFPDTPLLALIADDESVEVQEILDTGIVALVPKFHATSALVPAAKEALAT